MSILLTPDRCRDRPGLGERRAPGPGFRSVLHRATAPGHGLSALSL